MTQLAQKTIPKFNMAVFLPSTSEENAGCKRSAMLTQQPATPKKAWSDTKYKGISKKFRFCHNTLLLTKNIYLHISYMRRQHFLFAPRFV